MEGFYTARPGRRKPRRPTAGGVSRKERRDEGGSLRPRSWKRGCPARRGGRREVERGVGAAPGAGCARGGEGRAEGGPMPLRRPALPGGGLYSAECGATSEPAGNAPTPGRSYAAEPSARVTAARVQGRGPETRRQLERLAALACVPQVAPSRRCPHPPAT